MDSTEAQIVLQMWVAGKPPSSGPSLSKAPLLRDVPGVKKRSTRRESIIAHSKLDPFGSASPLRERPSRARLGYSSGGLGASSTSASASTSLHSAGSWKKVTAVLRSQGILSIYSEDRALLHSTLLSELFSHEIRTVDDSVFLRSNVISISLRVSTLARPSAQLIKSSLAAQQHGQAGVSPLRVDKSRATTSPLASGSSSSSIPTVEPLHLAFPTRESMIRWMMALHTFSKPEIYYSSPSARRESSASVSPSFTGSPSAQRNGNHMQLHRIHRSIHLNIIEARAGSIMESHTTRLRQTTGGTLDSKFSDPLLAADDRRSSQSSSASGTQKTDSLPGYVSATVLPTSPPRQGRKSLIHSESVSPGSPPNNKLRASGSFPTPNSPAMLLERAALAQKGEKKTELSSAALAANEATPPTDSASGSVRLLGPPIELGGSKPTSSVDTDEEVSYEKGPISGHSIGSSPAHWPSSPPLAAFSPSRKDSMSSSAFSSGGSSESGWVSCRVFVNGAMLARTSFKSTGDSMIWVEKFQLDMLPELRSFQIELLQQSTSRTGSIKQHQIGVVNLPVESLRRGEEVSGWFPIWLAPEDKEKDKDGVNLFDPTAKDLSSYALEIVGELKLAIDVQENVILPTEQYAKMEKALDGPGRALLVQRLASMPGEDGLLSTMVRYSTAIGSIVPLLTELAAKESEELGNDPDIDLLFRGNTALSRSLDKYQQLSCGSWLNASIGDFVQQICEEDAGFDFEELIQYNTPRRPSIASSDGRHSPVASPDGVVAFAALVEQMWESIYEHRHQCPMELREILQQLRTLVNARFTASGAAGSGIQGVGAFVFLRLFCPAITSPQLFGLVQTPPSTRASRILLMIAKAFLAMANKRNGFDQSKQPALYALNDFLKEQASAYDDFITFVSSSDLSGSIKAQQRLVSSSDTSDDASLQLFQEKRRSKLIPMHLDSLSKDALVLDKPLLLATLAAEVARVFAVQRAGSDQAVTDVFAFSDRASEEVFSDLLSACCEVDIESQMLAQLTKMGLCPGPIISTTVEPVNTRVASAVVTGGAARNGAGPSASPSAGVRMKSLFQRNRSATVGGSRPILAASTTHMRANKPTNIPEEANSTSSNGNSNSTNTLRDSSNSSRMQEPPYHRYDLVNHEFSSRPNRNSLQDPERSSSFTHSKPNSDLADFDTALMENANSLRKPKKWWQRM